MKPADKILRRLGISFVAESAGIFEFRLNSNSLKILLAPNASSRSVVYMQHVHVGSRHEGAGNTGYSHLLEHVLFKGTPKHNREQGNSYDEDVKALGNQMNAFTSTDMTAYFARVPRHGLPKLAEHEADRLRYAWFNDFHLSSEMPVVMSEFEIGENRPSEVLSKLISAIAYTEHPYKIDTIGSRSEVQKVTAASLRERLYDVYYHPNNVTVIIVGGFDITEALTHVARCYGEIPPAPRAIPKPYTVEPEQCGERRFVVDKPGDLPRLAMAFHVPEADHEHHYAIQALCTILGGSQASRLQRKLVDKGLASDASVSAQPTHDPGLLQISITATPGNQPAKLERIVSREIARLQKDGVSDKELALAKRLNRNGTKMSRASQMGAAYMLSMNEGVADWRWGTLYDEHFEKVTAADIQAVARLYLTANNRTVGYFLPNGAESAPKAQEEEHQRPEVDDNISSPTFEKTRMPALPKPSSDLSYAKQVQQFVLANGLTLQLMPTQTEAALGFALTVNAGLDRAPLEQRTIARLNAEMMTRGSKRFRKARIQDETAAMLVNYDWNVEASRAQLNTLVPDEELPLFLDILSDALTHPQFTAKELELVKTQSQADLEEGEKSPEDRAATALRQALYPPESPYYRLDVAARKAQLAAAGVEDLKAFTKHYGPQGAVLSIVGKFDPAQMRELIEAKLGSWSGGAAPSREPQLSSISARGGRVNINIPGKDSITILVGLPSPLSRRSPDYAAAFIANKALGGDTMASRLGYEIREKRGLTYGVYSYFADDLFGGAPWLVSMPTDRPNVERSLTLIDRIIKCFLKDGIGDKELTLEKSTQLNSYALSLDGPLDVAMALSEAHYAGLGVEALDQFEAQLLAVTKEQVNAALRAHFQVENAVTVVAGTLPESA